MECARASPGGFDATRGERMATAAASPELERAVARQPARGLPLAHGVAGELETGSRPQRTCWRATQRAADQRAPRCADFIDMSVSSAETAASAKAGSLM